MSEFIRKHTYSLFCLALSLLVIGAGLYTTYPIGAGVSGDAVRNLSVAGNLLAGKGFVDYSLAPLTWWPPLYPFIIAAISFFTRLDIFIAGWCLNIILLGLNIWLAGKLFHRVFYEQRIFAYLATLMTAFSLSFFRVSINIASDPLFFTFIIVFFLSVDAHVRTKSWKFLWLAAIVTALAGLHRYVGVLLIPIFVIAELGYRQGNFGRSLKKIIIFSLASALPISAWIVFHNYWLAGTLTGARNISRYHPYENLLDSLRKIINWYLPYPSLAKFGGGGDVIVIGTVVGILLIGIAILFLLNRGGRLKKFFSDIKDPSALPAIIFLVIYQSFLLFSVKTEDHISIWSDRYQIAGFYSLTIIIGLVIKDLILPNIKLDRKISNALFAMVFVIWAILPVYRFGKYIAETKPTGDSTYNIYNFPDFGNSRTISNLRQLLQDNPDAAIFSNWGGAIWFYTRNPVLALPTPYGVGIDTLKREIPVYIVWFQPNPNPYIYTIDELSQFYDLEIVTTESDGIIYLIPPSR